MLSAITTGSRAASHATRLRFRNASLKRRLGREQDHDLVDVRGERLLAPLVGAEEEVAARADALDRALRGAGEAHLDEVAAGGVLALALARADDLAAVGELHQELAPEIGDDAAFDDDRLARARGGSSSG